MSNTKISALTSATTPLAGTETLPIVQSSTTKQVSVANLTAGRAVSVASLTNSSLTSGRITYATTAGLLTDSSGLTYGVDNVILSYGGSAKFQVVNSSASNNVLMVANTSAAQLNSANGYQWEIQTASSTKLTVDSSSNVTVTLGNLVQGTATKGVNFTANTPAAGMTSQLLNWYETGTFTPNQGGALTVVGAYSSSGSYTRIGNLVTITALQSGATTIAVGASGQMFTNLPFTVNSTASRFAGVAVQQFTASIGTVAIGGTTNVYSAGTLAAAAATIVTTITYQV